MMNIVYATDNAYAPLAGVSIISLLENNKDEEALCIFVLENHVSEENTAKLQKIAEAYHRKLQVLDTAFTIRDLEEKGVTGYANADGNGLSVYARLYVQQLFPNLDKVLYLDCDTIITGSIRDLYDMKMGEKPIAMGLDCIHSRYRRFIHYDAEKCYYNSGVMLIDLARWKETDCFNRLMYHLIHVKSDYPLPDQDLINMVLGDDIAVIEMKYNYLSQYHLYGYNGTRYVYELQPPFFWRKEQWTEPEQAVILHFCGQTFIRPWYRNSKHPRKADYDIYYELSPWGKIPQEEWRMTLPYKVQYILWRYFPVAVSAFVGRLIQRTFMRLQYRV